MRSVDHIKNSSSETNTGFRVIKFQPTAHIQTLHSYIFESLSINHYDSGLTYTIVNIHYHTDANWLTILSSTTILYFLYVIPRHIIHSHHSSSAVNSSSKQAPKFPDYPIFCIQTLLPRNTPAAAKAHLLAKKLVFCRSGRDCFV